MKKIKIRITGMHCGSCAALLTDLLSEAGARRSKIDYRSGDASIEFDEDKTDVSKIRSIIRKQGYEVD